MTRTTALKATAIAAALVAQPALGVPLLPTFDVAAFKPGARIDNPYFPLIPGSRTVLRAEGEEDGETFTERSELTVLRGGPTILGVKATTQLDRAYEDDRLVEETYDYYAQDRVGNVWYLGEDVTNFRYDDDDTLIGTDNASAWRAGVNGALPGYIMPVDLTVGFRYYQEFAPEDDALDQAEIFAVGEVVTTGLGTFTDVLRIFETNPLEEDAREFKLYAPGIGVIAAAEGLDENFGDPDLVFEAVVIAPVPLPAGLPLGLAAFAALALSARARRRL